MAEEEKQREAAVAPLPCLAAQLPQSQKFESDTLILRGAIAPGLVLAPHSEYSFSFFLPIAMTLSASHHSIDVPYLARLARLEITSEEAEVFGGQLGRILDYVAQMNGLDISGIEPTAHAITVFDVIREDFVQESLPKPVILENAPHHANGLFVVPKVLD
jgi:aspartyl-tRNA(Asn)/glutamyl-tRNA(Gln) amidotransferase subunit C